MVKTRFAPSPTGYLHIGGLRTALYGYLFAKNNDGKFVLRIEDTDQNRLVEGAFEVITRTMKQAGLFYDEGPDAGGDFGPYVQSERRDIYSEYAKKLVETGGAYYCFCDKDRLDNLREQCGDNYKYDKHCLSLSKEEVQSKLDAGVECVIRQNIPLEGESSYDDLVFGKISVPCADMEDGILLKSDGMPTYNLANVIDDHLMGITHVIRGSEYLSSTPKYNLIYDSYGWERPIYIHLSPVMKDKQRKLSKRHGDASYEDFIAKGYLKEAIINYIALLGWSPAGEREIFSLEELAEVFSLEGISKSPAIFDVDKLTWMNAEYIRALPAQEFLAIARPHLDEVLHGKFDYEYLLPLIQPRLEVLTQIPEKVRFLAEFDEGYDIELYTHKKMKTNPENCLPVLEKAKEVLEGLQTWDEQSIKSVLMGMVEEMGVKTGQVLWPVRIAIAGVAVTPGGAYEIAVLLGKEESLRRMDKGIDKLK